MARVDTDLAMTAKEIRRRIIGLANRSGSPHVGSCLSCVDILTALYFDVMTLAPWESRDYFILSKGHAAMALYVTLAAKGIIDPGLLDGYYADEGTLPAHLDRFSAEGIEVSAGSLGHGLSIGLGLAHGFRMQGEARNVYVLMGDGETQEGSVWEAALFAPKLGLGNLTMIIDFNNLQGYGRATEICEFEPLRDKWEAFGWCVFEVDGHDIDQIRHAVSADSKGRPKAVIARTIKGKGVSFMEDQLIWHYYQVTDSHRDQALKELG